MKKAIVFAALVMSLSNVYALEKNDKERPRHHTFAELNLSQEQQVKMRTLRERHQAEKQSMQLRHQADVRAILTPEQSAAFEKSAAERQAHRMQGRKMIKNKSE